jgi:chromosome segregation ATPase
MWFGRKRFEEGQAALEGDIQEAYERLNHAREELEGLVEKLKQERYHTAKLAHWKAMSLRTMDGMVNREKKLRDVGNVNIARLLAKLENGKNELENLRVETDEMDEEFTQEVRVPMEECDRTRRYLIQIQAENAAEGEKMKMAQIVQESPFLSKMARENEDLRKENEDLKMKIEELQATIAEMKPETLKALEGLFEPAPKEPLFPRRSIATSRATKRPRLTTPRVPEKPKSVRT